MERLVLPLEGGMTGVVGPNGCGKSNIVDALRWVLGETRANNLRGDVLEDVIFNGTDKLRPLGLAEVTITLRATEQDFFADLVSPSLEADLIASIESIEAPAIESEDVLDDSTVNEGEEKPRLTVIDGALSANFNVTEEQGIPEPVAPEATPDDGTPAAGSDESDAEAEVANRATMLTRFAWLKSVTEVQVTRRLYRSGESEFFINRVQCRLKDIKDFFRAVGLGARSHTIIAQG
jgi:hypothetical protein